MPSTSKVRTKAELKYFKDDAIDVLPNQSVQQCDVQVQEQGQPNVEDFDGITINNDEFIEDVNEIEISFQDY